MGRPEGCVSEDPTGRQACAWARSAESKHEKAGFANSSCRRCLGPTAEGQGTLMSAGHSAAPSPDNEKAEAEEEEGTANTARQTAPKLNTSEAAEGL